jgi:hypothetical protein
MSISNIEGWKNTSQIFVNESADIPLMTFQCDAIAVLCNGKESNARVGAVSKKTRTRIKETYLGMNWPYLHLVMSISNLEGWKNTSQIFVNEPADIPLMTFECEPQVM